MNLTSNNDELITKDRLIEDFSNLGIIDGDNLVVTSSLRSIGKIEGGAQTVLESLIEVVGSRGSIFGLSFTPKYLLPLSSANGKKVFCHNTPTNTGTFNELLLRNPSSIRSKHPTHSFVGIGIMANLLLAEHNALKPSFDPIYHLAQQSNSKFLLLGTVDKCPGVTTVHVAQNLLGFRNKSIGKFGVNYLDDKNEIHLYVHNEVGGCSRGFWKFYNLYRKADACNEGTVGNADAMLVSLQDSLKIDLAILKENPKYFFCDDPWCFSCRVSWPFSEKTLSSFILRIIEPVLWNIYRVDSLKHLLRSIKKKWFSSIYCG